MAAMIHGAYFDYVWVQFYNTAACSARSYFNNDDGGATISWDDWSSFLKSSANPNVPLFLGIPGAPAAAPSHPNDFLSLTEVKTLIDLFGCSGKLPNPQFGGVMMWEATFALNNDNCAGSVKSLLDSCACAPKASSTTTVWFPSDLFVRRNRC
jgi:chitinase